MKNLKSVKIISVIFTIIMSMLLIYSSEVLAAENTTIISLSDEKITVNGEAISEDTSKEIYLSSSMNNGGNSKESLDANIEVSNVININSSGTYEFTGELSDGQISVNTNEIKGEVIIVLNNAKITCANAPVIFVYNKETNSSTCTITIKTASGSSNILTGGKIKQSVEGWSDQEDILYYVEKDYDDEGKYYERYKYDGAISSDISLTFEGEGDLTINSTEKEGIEVKRDITINSGNYTINSLDDGINAAADGKSVITINGGTLLINLKEESEEGDGIDSNGYFYINGGKIYAFASELSADSGLDSEYGITINGGYVVGIGSMADVISEDSKQEFLMLQFNTNVSKDTLITLTDEEKNLIVAFKGDREYATLLISTPDLKEGEYIAYEGGEIEGTSENGLYTEIVSYTEGTVKEYRKTENREMMNQFTNITSRNVYYYTIIILGVLLVICIIVAVVLKKKGKIEFKGIILSLTIGILIGAILATTGFMNYNKVSMNSVMDNGREMRGEQMLNNMQRPEGEMPMEQRTDGEIPSGERPEMPLDNSNEKV